MVDEIDLNAFLSSPYAADVKRQQQAYLSAQNIRKATESVEEYKARMAKYKEELRQQLINENPDKTVPEKIVLVYAWNELGEGGYLVPTKADPSAKKLKEIKKAVFK